MNGELIRVLAALLTAAATVLFLKQYRPEYAIILSVAAAAVTLIFILSGIIPAVKQVRELFEKSGIAAGYFSTALKALGIAYITGFAADACRDFGQVSLAAKAELAGRCAIFVLTVPLLRAVLETALGFAGL